MKNNIASFDFAAARDNMVDGQLRPNRITDKALLARFAMVAREEFVPAAQAGTAYVDAPQGLGAGREMFSPMVLAHLIQGLVVDEISTVMIMAGGAGYSAALLAGLVAKVVLVEDDKALMAVAKTNLADLKNVVCVQAGVEVGAPKQGPYDAILLDAAVGHVPPALLAQLRDGGKLATVRPGADGVLEACVVVKHGGAVFEEALFETKGHLLPALQVAEGFVF